MSAVAGLSQARPRSATAIVDEGALLSLVAGLDASELRNAETRARDGHGTDTDVALALLAEDTRRQSQVRDDGALAQTLAEEIDEDVNNAASPIEAHAERIAPVPDVATVTAAIPGNSSQLRAPAAINPATPGRAHGTVPRSKWFSPVVSLFSKITSTNGSTDTRPTCTGHDCVVCQDPITGCGVCAPCGHFYDKSCILDLFDSATRDESLFPPRCCRQPIPLASVQSLMTKELRSTFKEKSVEFGTPNRVYCAEPRCSRFLGPRIDPAKRSSFLSPLFYGCSGQEHSHLEARRAFTCSTCKVAITRSMRLHHRCFASSSLGGDSETLQVGAAQGWARCPGCEQLIELDTGCYHMTCRCRTEFCYLCRARWKSCRCPQWDENRLLAAAEARVDQQFGAAVAPAPVRRERAPPPVAPVAPVRAPAPAPTPVPVAARPAANARAWESAPAIPPTIARTQHNIASSKNRSWHGREAALRNSLSAVEQGFAAQAALTPTSVSGPSSRKQIVSSSSGSTSSGAGSNTWRSSVHSSPVTGASAVQHKLSQAERARRVREAMDELRVNHHCIHSKWRYRRGGGRCQNCFHDLPIYLLCCQGCQMLACRRCKNNRL